MSFKGRRLRDHDQKSVCIHLEHSKNCVMTKVSTQKAKKLMNPFTADQKENHFFFISEFIDIDENDMIFKTKVFPENQEFCENQESCTKQILKVSL